MAVRRIKTEPLYELVPTEKPKDLNPEEACGEMRSELRIGRSYPGGYQRLRLALFVLRKFHDPGMAAASFLQPGRHGEYLKAKDSAFINRCNLYDFYRAAERYLVEYGKDRSPGGLRCFCEYFVKVERFERLHAPRTMSGADEERLAGDRARYLRALTRRVDAEVVSGRLDRTELDAMMERSGRFLD